jgi:hypothetical protein
VLLPAFVIGCIMAYAHGRGGAHATLHVAGPPAAEMAAAEIGRTQDIGRVTASQPPMPWLQVSAHVLVLTILINLGKMFPAFCYRREAHWRERLAVALACGHAGRWALVYWSSR